MNKQSLFRQLRTIILILITGVLAIDTFSYYFEEATATEITGSDTTTLTSALVPSVSPTSTPVNDTKPSLVLITSFTEIEKINTAKIQAAQSSFLHSTHPTPITNISVYTLEYKIIGRSGNWEPVSAKIYIPDMDGKYPLFIFGSGTTGIADKCAPSLENMAVENLGNYHNHMIAQAAEGYATVFPDYEGFHNPDRTQAYFISESEAKTLLGSIQSLLELKNNNPIIEKIDIETVFLSGYSQGGHSALSAAKAWDQLPESVTLAGIVEFAGAADVQALFVDSPWLASYLVQSYTEYYGSNLQSFAILQDKWLRDLKKNNDELCVNDAYKFYPQKSLSAVYSPSFIDALESDTWPATLANWHDKIRENTPLSNVPNVPHLSIQGGADPIVTAATQINNLSKLCQQGHAVTYMEYAGVNHFDIRKAGFELSNQWMRDVQVGNPVTSSCP
jgi:pimeloyl-ACP methyl ester carboxylesterase